MSAEAIARLRRCVESADRLKVVCPPGYVSPQVDDLRALLDAHAALEAAHTEALDALDRCEVLHGADMIARLHEDVLAVLAKAGRR